MDQHEQEVRRLTELLDAVVRVTRHTRRDIEQELGLGSASLSKILSGTVRLQVIHLLMIAEAVGMTPGEFFKLAYPGVELRSPAARSVAATLGLSPGSGAPESPGEFEERVKQALLHLLGVKGATAVSS
jgi:hypothetical protein